MARIENEIESLKEQIDELAERLTRLTKHAEKDFGSKLEDGWNEAKDETQKSWNNTKKVSEEKIEEVQKYAKENPWQVAGAAIALGFILGQISHKRKD